MLKPPERQFQRRRRTRRCRVERIAPDREESADRAQTQVVDDEPIVLPQPFAPERAEIDAERQQHEQGGSPAELERATLATLFVVNTIDPIALIVSAQPTLAQSASEGREPFIVTLSGVVAEAPVAGLAAYSASKAALASFVVAAAREYRRAGIRIMDARPGHTATELSQHPIAGSAPAFGPALDPDAVAARIVRAIADGEKDLPSTAFAA